MKRPASIVALAPLALQVSLSSAAASQDRAETRVPEINVSARVTLQRPPDFAAVRVGVTHRADKAADAARPNAAAARAVVAAMIASGIPAESVTTVGYTVLPEYAPDRRRVLHYAARTILLVRVSNVDQIGGVINEALRAGATEINQITFGLSQMDEVRRAALAQAVRQVRGDADALATAAGGHAGPLIRLNVGNPGVEQPIQGADLRLARGQLDSAGVPPITPGEIAITVFVSAQFQFIPTSGR